MNTTQTRFGTLQIGIIILAIATALVHIVLAIQSNLLMFYLNGFGYLALTLALFIPQFQNWRKTVRWILIAYTAVTIVGWIVIGQRITIAYIDKVIELALIALLWMDRGRE